LLVAGFSSPAAANAFTDLFSFNSAPAESTAAAAPAQDDCLQRPGEQTAAGQHWVYRYDGHRKCWFQAAEEGAVAKKPPRHRAARRSAADAEQDKSASRKQKDVEDARAELTSSPPAEAPQPTPPEPQVKVVKVVRVADAAPVPATDAAAQVPPVLVPTMLGAAQPTSGQPASDQSRLPQVDVDKLLAEAPAASDEVASAAPGTNTPGGADWIASWFGMLLMGLGCAALLSASPTLRQAVGSVRSRNSGTELPVTADESTRHEPAFGRIAAALEHDDRTRRAAAAPLPAPEALWDEGLGALAALTGPVSPEAFSGRPAMAYRGAEQQGHWSDS